MFQLLVATTNPGKIKEITDLLAHKYIKILSLADFPEYRHLDVAETGATFAENALIKARLFGRLSGLTTLADDSGLSVDALDGRPGVMSKRYAKSDPERIRKLLTELKDVSTSDRRAHYTCSMALYDPSSDRHHLAEGEVQGQIALEPAGNNGFGYDPVFFCPEIGKTFGQASALEKNQISHRSIALSKMKKIIAKRCR